MFVQFFFPLLCSFAPHLFLSLFVSGKHTLANTGSKRPELEHLNRHHFCRPACAGIGGTSGYEYVSGLGRVKIQEKQVHIGVPWLLLVVSNLVESGGIASFIYEMLWSNHPWRARSR